MKEMIPLKSYFMSIEVYDPAHPEKSRQGER